MGREVPRIVNLIQIVLAGGTGDPLAGAFYIISQLSHLPKLQGNEGYEVTVTCQVTVTLPDS
jgi:hypothetical protein